MQVTVIKSNRKTVGIQVRTDLRVIVRVPLATSKTEVDRILKDNAAWIEKHLEQMKQKAAQRQTEEFARLTNEEIQKLADQALQDIPKRVEDFAKKICVSYGRITIRNQRTRWGSCSSKGNLNFNCLLMLAPPAVRDYVVVHELCHRKEMNHSGAFWAEVKKILPDYKISVQWLKDEGGQLIRRMG